MVILNNFYFYKCLVLLQYYAGLTKTNFGMSLKPKLINCRQNGYVRKIQDLILFHDFKLLATYYC